MCCLLTCLLLFSCTSAFADSTNYGTTAKGKIEGAVQLPNGGKNFSVYLILRGPPFISKSTASQIAI